MILIAGGTDVRPQWVPRLSAPAVTVIERADQFSWVVRAASGLPISRSTAR